MCLCDSGASDLSLLRMVSSCGYTSFPLSVTNHMHKHTQTYSMSSGDVGQLQAEIRKRRKGSKGKKADRGDYCTGSLMGYPALKTFPKHMTLL